MDSIVRQDKNQENKQIEKSHNQLQYWNMFYNWSLVTIFVMVTAFSLLIGSFLHNYDVMLMGTMVFWLYSLFYGLTEIDNKFAYTIMQFMVFVFLSSRPFFAYFYNVEWAYWSSNTLITVFWLIYTIEIVLFFSCKLSEPIYRERNIISYNIDTYSEIRIVLVILLIVSGMCKYYVGYVQFRTFGSIDYAELYTNEVALDVPFLISHVGGYFDFVVFAYLAMQPNKMRSVIVLCAYIISGVPLFMLGNRSSLVLKIAFAVVYFFLRNKINNGGEKWITNRIKIGFILFALVAIVFLGAFNYIRANSNIETAGGMPVFVDFFYKQGTTFDTVCQGLQYERKIKAINNDYPYSASNIINSMQRGKLGRIITGKEPFDDGNNIKYVDEGSDLAHILSYVVLGERYYLAGHGRGSSFVLETYFDGGIVLLILYTFAVGLLLSNLSVLYNKSRLLGRYLLLSILANVFLIPRASACSFLTQLVSPYFWAIPILLLMAYLFTKIKWIDKIIYP